MTNTNETYQAIQNATGAELTNRLIQGDENFEYPEWQEFGEIDNIPVIVYYRTTPEDAELAKEQDWGVIDWGERIERICLNTTKCSEDGVDHEKAKLMCDEYNIEFEDFL